MRPLLKLSVGSSNIHLESDRIVSFKKSAKLLPHHHRQSRHTDKNMRLSFRSLTPIKALLASTVLSFSLALSACATQADPEPFMGFECSQLRMMSEADAPIDPFAANKVGPSPQAGLIGDRNGLQTDSDVRAETRNEETRAIQAAYRKKGC